MPQIPPLLKVCLISTLDASVTLCRAVYLCVKKRMKSRNESSPPDNSSLGSLSCCQPGEQRGWKSLPIHRQRLVCFIDKSVCGAMSRRFCTPPHTPAPSLSMCLVYAFVSMQIGGMGSRHLVMLMESKY